MKMKCETPNGIVVHKTTFEMRYIPCGKWTCPACGPRKKNVVLDRAKTGFFDLEVQKGHRARALTLTLGPDADNALMGRYFARFRAYLAKKRKDRKGRMRCFRRINYFWTKEFMQNGKQHLHVLIDVFIPVNIIRKAWTWATYGTSRIVHIASRGGPVRNAAAYMTKYMTKELQQQHKFKKGEHRYGFSQYRDSPFRLKPKEKTGEWEYRFLYSVCSQEMQYYADMRDRYLEIQREFT